MKAHRIAGAGGTQLHVVETGNPHGRPILLIHGFSQCSLAWSRQLDSDLAAEFRLVAPDLRGHGQSDKPREGYGDSRAWADDLDAVIRALRLDAPVLVSWSYGLVPLDYLRHHGEAAIGGLHLVGAITKLGSEDAMSMLTPATLEAAPGLLSNDAETCARSLQGFVRLCYARELAPERLYLMLGYNVAVPPWVRQAMFGRVVDNDDVLARIRTPVLITHGADDRVVKAAAAERHRARIPHSELHLMPRAGHAPFDDDAEAFNARLRGFARSL